MSLAPGDHLRFFYSSSAAANLAIVGIDETGNASIYASAGEASIPIAPGANVVLDEAIELDETLGHETFVAIVCPQPQKVTDIVARANDNIAGCRRFPLHVMKAR